MELLGQGVGGDNQQIENPGMTSMNNKIDW